MLEMLGDLNRDLEVFAEGRGTHSRCWAIREQTWKLEELGRKLDANYKEVIEPEVVPETPPSHRLDKAPTLRLTDNRALSPKNLF